MHHLMVTPQHPQTGRVQVYRSGYVRKKKKLNDFQEKKLSLPFTAICDGTLHNKEKVSLNRRYLIKDDISSHTFAVLLLGNSRAA